jgi:hypothetical protein
MQTVNQNVIGLMFFSVSFIMSTNAQTTLQSNVSRTDAAKHFAPDTISSIQQQIQPLSVFRAPNGKYYNITIDDMSVDYLRVRDSLYCITDWYLGTKRKRSKTTLVLKKYKNYKSVAAFRASLLSDSFMQTLNISSDSGSVRVVQEKRNITIDNAYIYAVSREDDNDYHVIIADTLPYDSSRSINVEFSGLPNPSNQATDSIQNARVTFESFMGEKCSGAYTKFNPPVAIKVSGSLFYDVDHAPGIIGTGIYKPNTSWELHPVSFIMFK